MERLYWGVRSGLLLGDEESVDLFEYVEAGLVITLDHGLLFIFVGVVLRLVQDETDDVAGDEASRLLYHDWSFWRLTMDMVCCRPCWGLGYSIAGVRHGEFEACCMAAVFGYDGVGQVTGSQVVGYSRVGGCGYSRGVYSEGQVKRVETAKEGRIKSK